MSTPFTEANAFYLFDKRGLSRMRDLSELIRRDQPPAIKLAKQALPAVFSIGKTGSGIGLHQ